MTDTPTTTDKKPNIAFQVSESEHTLMHQDAKDIKTSVSSIMKTLKDKYWDSYIAKHKRVVKK